VDAERLAGKVNESISGTLSPIGLEAVCEIVEPLYDLFAGLRTSALAGSTSHWRSPPP
jgi:hypothetical protein